MKLLWILLLLPTLVMAEAPPALPAKADYSKVPLIIQPYYVRDIYRNQISDSIPFHVTILTLRNFDNDHWEESEKYSLSQKFTKINPKGSRPLVMLGDSHPDLKGMHLSIFRDPDCLCYLVNGRVIQDEYKSLDKAAALLDSKYVYVLSDFTDVAISREKSLRNILKIPDVSFNLERVSNATELRAQLVAWNKKPRGILFINSFDLVADSGKRIRYRYIEQMVTEFNTTHLEVGIYRKNHRSALAIGIAPRDIGRIIVSKLKGTAIPIVEVSSSVNIARIKDLGLLHMAAGSFKEAFLYEPIDTR